MERIARGEVFARAFPPAAGEGARVLVLGSMPSVESLRTGRYYGHPRNHFWPLVFGIYGKEPPEDYGERIGFLMERGIALWDVLAGCRRRGSLDSAIRDERYNDFAAFFAKHPAIETVFFNGRKAEGAFLRYLKSGTEAEELPGGRRLRLLPSSSPVPTRAMRRMEDKLPAWRAVREAAEGRSDR